MSGTEHEIKHAQNCFTLFYQNYCILSAICMLQNNIRPYVMASYQTFSNLAGQILHTLSIEKSLSLQKTMSVQTIFSPYYKH